MIFDSVFLWGAFGALAIEIITFCKYFVEGRSHLPKCYSNLGFYILNFAIIFVSGSFAYAYGIDSPLLAIHIGASTPLFFSMIRDRDR